MNLEADADGFFALHLPSGVYTLALTTRDGYPRPVTVTVVTGRLVAAAVIGGML